ncbi:MAG: protein kinase [Steroidobacteraceae bacterium]|nr:protein kinase [Steroidobacteraceae bacterium]
MPSRRFAVPRSCWRRLPGADSAAPDAEGRGCGRTPGERGARGDRGGVVAGCGPEQAQGATLDARSDLYSLGVVFFEMLSGRKPYTGATAIEVLQNHVSAPIPLLPAEHAALQPLIDRLLAKLPVQRFASAGELLAALPPVDGEPVAAPRHDAAPDVATA